MNSFEFRKVRVEHLKVSQSILASMLGMARNSVSRMELGSMPIEIRTELALKWLVHISSFDVEHIAKVNQTVDVPVKPKVNKSTSSKLTHDFEDVHLDVGEVAKAITQPYFERKRVDKRAKNRASRKKKQKSKK